MTRRLLTTTEVGVLIGKSPFTVRKMCRRGELPAVRLGNQHRVPEDALARFMAGLVASNT